MKISAFHKSRGDIVEWWQPIKKYDLIYSSKIFSWTLENKYLPKNTIKGGTGYNIHSKLPSEIENCYPDYSIYPNCDYAIGFITRGCIRKCNFCIVPEKEGNINPYSKWQDIIRNDSNKIVLMDNNILACDYGISQLGELSKANYKIDINQGMDIRLLNDDICKILKNIKWIKYIRFACDNKDQIHDVVKMVELFDKYKLPKSRVFFYVIIRDVETSEFIIQSLNKIYNGFSIYAQAEIKRGEQVNKLNKEFSRYVMGRCYYKHNWESYKEKYLKTKLKNIL